MSEHEVQAGPVVKVARDLREIETLFEALLVQAIHKASDRIDGTSLPGGEAMVALAPVGSPDEWQEWVAADELRHFAICPKLDHTRCRYAERVEDEDGVEPPLQTLLFWSEQWRTEAGYSLGRRPTVRTEVNFLRGRLDWAWDNLAEWDDFAADVRRARTRMENLLMAGERAQRGAPCMYDECRGARLVRRLEPYRDERGQRAWRWSNWHCPKCKRSWDEERYAAHVAAAHWSTQFEQIGDEVWGSVKYVARQTSVPESTIRAWVTQTKQQRHRVDVEYPVVAACLRVGRRDGFVCQQDVEARRDRPRGRKGAA